MQKSTTKEVQFKDGFTNSAEAFTAFIEHLKTKRRPYLKGLSSLNNGFEGWLKIEFYLWLKQAYNLADDCIGMESKVRLRIGNPSGHKKQKKQIDLWVWDEMAQGFHYIELKVPFCNQNKTKMFASAALDLSYMHYLYKVEAQRISSSVIVMGVGFDEEQWDNGMLIVKERNKAFEPVSSNRQLALEIKGKSPKKLFWECVTCEA